MLPPDVNRQRLHFTPVAPATAGIRFGLGAIKNVGHGAVEAIAKAREKAAPFTLASTISASAWIWAR